MRQDIAIALREQGAYAEAVGLLDGTPVPDGALRALWLQSHAMALRRLGEGEPDESRSEELWAQAGKLLDALLAVAPPSAETCGIAAGLAKRRFARFLEAGQHAKSDGQLAKMINLYQQGFEAEPWDYYVGVNLVASLRLRGQRFSLSQPDDLARARSLLSVVRLMVGRLPPPMRTFWPSVTQAELVLHEYLLDDPGGRAPAGAVIIAYAEALARQHPPDYEKAAYDQLDIFRRAGDPPEFIAAVQEVFPPRPAR
jgi:hypothetical protein